MTDAFIDVNSLDLTQTELSIIDEYTGGESLWINNFLRQRNLEQLTEKQIENLRLKSIYLNKIIKKSPVSTKSSKIQIFKKLSKVYIFRLIHFLTMKTNYYYHMVVVLLLLIEQKQSMKVKIF